ncbi:toll/interleukin-1 receptor domain-containing protein [Hydrogenophaga sp.]|uniref:toll/interleukin-1 receptor domain-containing protein n=1 Tax=Hydrogenophaga sp. TaxID=1904254 RepID=UPI00286E3490|nr:toll/interleukin-1 receptor domain-containing protein [Hydrogenophaga sp.]
MKDFFISYNQADKGWAEWIAWQLEAAGFQVVIQAWDFRQGGNFVLDMQRAVEAAQRTIVVLSPDFLASRFTAPEWAAAFAQDPTGRTGRLLPVRVRECQPSGLLAQIVYIDLVGLPDRAQAREQLLKGVTQGRAKPDAEPDMPPLEVATSPPSSLDDEPPWPPSLEVATSVAGHVFWCVARVATVVIVVALAVRTLLARALPNWADSSPGTAVTAALLWGLAMALLVEALLRLWRRRVASRTLVRSPM